LGRRKAMNSKTYVVRLTEDEIRYLLEYVGKDIGWHRKYNNKAGEERARRMYEKLKRAYRGDNHDA